MVNIFPPQFHIFLAFAHHERMKMMKQLRFDLLPSYYIYIFPSHKWFRVELQEKWQRVLTNLGNLMVKGGRLLCLASCKRKRTGGSFVLSESEQRRWDHDIFMVYVRYFYLFWLNLVQDVWNQWMIISAIFFRTRKR